MEVRYTPAFVGQFKALEAALREEVLEKIESFKNSANHRRLKVHKLRGRLAGRWSFAVNYRFRVVFCYLDKRTAVLLAVGDHDVYRWQAGLV